ncbi:sulfatase-like hydrolase/transferase [Candidatus Laterigemmans baculatus]|uniref:sulfatase-like hydrolase/transferase n=1 Tax=Candidatus Laterigemmans baculatus TaxID=2770505 RepID=UPI0013DBBD75|nr:sulfatase-like hydrolase/transferase [Candidatus Laterigemmans baculatus]
MQSLLLAGILPVTNRAVWTALLVVFGVVLSVGTPGNARGEEAAPGEVKEQGAKDPRPNILIITADNLGYGDLATYNRDSSIRTPELDRLASQGARLTQFYTASPTCTVSRACLLTGRIPERHGLVDQLAGVEGNYGVGLDQDEILIPQMLKQAATPYATGCFGKWNIGFAEGSRPTDRGFDEFLGHASGNMDYYHHHYRDRHDLYQGSKEQGIKELFREGTYASDLFADAAIEFIERKSKRSEPWFVYLPFNAPHFPTAGNKRPGQANIWQAPEWALAAYGLSPDEPDPAKRYAAVVTALDAAIGRVLQAVDASGEAERTFVFFMSDNGAFRLDREGLDVGSNAPLRSGGVTCWEGGLRVVAFARWPGQIAAGSVIEEPLWSPDLMVACSALAAAPLPEDRVYDGRNPLPVLCGEAESPHRSLYFRYRNHAALRKGDWKIVREKPAAPWQLFNLAADPAETADRARQEPGRVAELTAAFSHWEASF